MSFNKPIQKIEEEEPILPEIVLGSGMENNEKSVIQQHSETLFVKSLKDRIIWVDLEIDTQRAYIAPTILDIEKQIIDWNREDAGKPAEERKPIKLLLYCFGGDLDATLSLVSVMNISKTPVYTYNMGVAYSGGFLLLVNGHKRFALPYSTGLFHEGSADFQGNAEEIRSTQSNYERLLKLIKENISSHTKIDIKTLNKYKNKEWYISATQLLEYGVVDEIISDVDKIFC